MEIEIVSLKSVQLPNEAFYNNKITKITKQNKNLEVEDR